MPVLVIHGLSDTVNVSVLKAGLCVAIVADVPELGLTTADISVRCPVDLDDRSGAMELICFVDGLFVKPERTPEVRQKLSDSIYTVLTSYARQFIPRCQLIEVFVKQFNPEKDGFTRGDPQQM